MKRVSAKRAKAKAEITDSHTRARTREWFARNWREQVPAIVADIESGVPLQPACVRNGVSPDTVRDAIDRRDPDAEPIQVARAALEAELAQAFRSQALSGEAATGVRDLLARIAPKRWHLPERIHIGGDEDAPPVRSEAAPVTEAQLLARLEVLRSKLGGAK